MNSKGFIGLLGLLITTVLIGVMVYFAFTEYFSKPSVSQQTQNTMKEVGINTSSQLSVVQSVTSQLKDIEAMQERQSQGILNSYK